MPRWAVFLAAVLPPFATYLFLLNPTVPAGDSGELITAAATMGVAHPPGYPLYVWLGHLWALLVPWGSVAWRLNLLSAVCAALAAGVLALAVLKLTRSAAAALVAAWTLAFSAPLWKYAEVAEVFALNALLVALALLATAQILTRAEPSPEVGPNPSATAAPTNPWPFATLAFLATAEFSHHHTLVLLLAPVLALILALQLGPQRFRTALGSVRPFRFRWRDLASVLIAGAAGLLPLVHLATGADADRALVWGDPGSVPGFLRHLLRVEYGSLRLDPLDAGLRADRSHIALYLESLPHGIGPPAFLLGMVGLVAVVKRHRALAVALAGFAIAQALFFTRVGFPSDVPLLRGVVERFYIMPNTVVALLAGMGAAAVLGWRPAQRDRSRGSRAARSGRRATEARQPGPARLAALAGAALALAALAWPLATHARLASQRGNRFTEHLGRSVLASVPDRGVLFVQGDLFHNALQYLTRVERLRPDVVVIDQALMTYDWYIRQIRRQHPDVLPPLGRAERIRLRDGTVLEGRAIPRPDGTTDLLSEDGQRTVESSAIAAVEAVADPAAVFTRSRAAHRRAWLLEMGEDRYSGLPGTRNLIWLDHLLGRRPVVFTGLKDDSWALRYEMIPIGMAVLAYPRGRVPQIADRIDRTLAVLAETELEDYFRPFDPWSFEATERVWLIEVAKRAAPLLCQPEAAQVLEQPRARVGRERLLAFARRFETLDPSPDPACLRAVGLLRWFDPGFRDAARARSDLQRYLATSPQGADADETRRVLQQIESLAPR